MSDDDRSAGNRPRSRVTRVFEDMRQGAATARRQRWTIISTAAVSDATTCEDAGCDCGSFVGQYKPPASRR